MAILNSLGNAAYNISGASSFMKGVRGARKDGLDLGDVGNIALGLGQGALFAIPGGGGALAAGRVAAAAAKTAGAGRLARQVPRVKSTAKGLNPIKYAPTFGKNIKTSLTTRPGLKQTAIRAAQATPIVGGIAGISAFQNRQPSTTSKGTIQNQVIQQPNLTRVMPNDGTLKPRIIPRLPIVQAPKASVPPKAPLAPIKTPPRVVQPPVTTRTTQPSTQQPTTRQPTTLPLTKQPSTETITTQIPTTLPGTTPSTQRGTPTFNYETGELTYVDEAQQRRDEAAKIALDKYNQSTYNDELQRNYALAEQQRFSQEQNEIAQRGLLQQQKTQLENKTYGVPPYLEAASKRYQGGLARSQALGAIREQDIRDALSQRQMSARGRSAGIVGGLAPALLGSGLTGAGRSYKLDTRNEVLRRAEEQAALKESYDVYLAEAARQSQLAQLEDAKTRSLLVDQIRSLGSN